MEATDRLQLQQVLHERRDEIAKSWRQAVEQGHSEPPTALGSGQRFVEMTEQVSEIFFTEPFVGEKAREVGASLAKLQHLDPEALGRTQTLLAQQLVDGLPADLVALLNPKLTRLLAEMATGFVQHTTTRLTAETEMQRRTLTRELQQAQHALRQTCRDMEHQIQQPTADLAAANRRLQEEDTQRRDAETQVQRQLREATLLHRISTRIALAEDMIAALQSVCTELARFLQVPQAGFALLNADSSAAEVVADFHPPDSPSAMGTAIPVTGNPSMTYILENKTPLAVSDAQTDPRLAPVHKIMRQRHVASILIVPIIADGNAIGTLGFDTFEKQIFSQSDIDLVQSIANQAGQVLLRKRAEEALQSSEEALRALLNATTDVLMLTDVDGIILVANETAARRFEMSGPEFIGSCIWDLMAPDVAGHRLAQAEEILESGKPVRFEDWRAGTWFDNVVHPVFDAQDRIKGFAVFSRDISRRRRMEEALKESEGRLSSILSAMVDFVFAFDRNGRFTFYHAPSGEDPYVLPHEILGKPFIEVMPTHLHEFMTEAFSKNERGEVVEHEYWLEINGEIRWFFAKLSPVSVNGEFQGSVAVAREITKRRQAEQALRTSEATIRAMLNAPEDLVVLTDPDGVILEGNEAFARRFDMPADQLIGVKGWDLLPAGLAESRRRQVDKVLASRRPVRFEDESAGTWFDNLIYPVLDARDQPARIALFARDITERKQMEEKLRQSLDGTARNQQMLLALSQAAQAVQRAHTPEEIYRTIGEEIAGLGYEAMVFTLTADRQHLSAAHITYGVGNLYANEESTGFSPQDYQVPVEPGGPIEQLIETGKTLFSAEPDKYITQIRPGSVGPSTGRGTSSMGIEQAIFAPLIVGDKMHGILLVTGSGLREVDTQAVNAFANQTAIALENARLYQEIRTWAAQLEQRVAQRTQELAATNLELETALAERQRAEETVRRSREETIRSHRLLLALSQAAEAVQHTRTPDKVYQTIGDEVAKLGYRVIVFTLTADQSHLFLSHLTMQLNTLEAAQKLSTHLPEGGLQIPLTRGEPFQRVVTRSETVLLEQTEERLVTDFPSLGRALQGQLLAVLGPEKSIYAPLNVRGRTHGVLSVAGPDLTMADLPTITLFANRAAIAIENAQLMTQLTTGRLQLQRLARQVVTAQEEERQRLSRALHDEAGQALTALKISLNLIGGDLPNAEISLRRRIGDAAALTDITMERIRMLAQDLRPPALDAVGLNHTLEGLCQDFGERTKLAIDYQGQELPRLPGTINIVLYRFVQEALTNVAKHASAKRVSVVLQHDDERLSLLVEDDGRGFDPQAKGATSSGSTGIGLLGMQERIESLGGQLETRSQPGFGTRLTAHIPL
jgi:PAS domain S-box-containing protein